MRLTPVIVLATLTLAPSFLTAQSGENPREVQLKALEYQRKMLLAMADSMPERLYRDKATPTQRDFAQQIQHAAGAAAFVASATLGGPKPTLPDTGVSLNSRAGLRAYVNAAFDHLTGLQKGQSTEARRETVKLFGSPMPAWQVWDEIHTHTVWTAGQVVANFRKHGMAPPAFTFF
jgi:hypothetical protein